MWPSFPPRRFLQRTSQTTHRDGPRAKRKARPAFRPRFETLEDRWMPANITWMGGADTNWSNPANWVGGAVPGAQDTAVFDNTSGTHNVAVVDVAFVGPIAGLTINPSFSGEITVANPLTVTGTYSQAGGVVDGAADLTLAGTATWSAGTMGTNPPAPNGATIIAAIGTLTLSSGNDKVLNNRTLNNLGTITWTGGNLLGNNGAFLNNRGGGTVDMQAATRFYSSAGTAAIFFNAGTLKKTVSPGTASIEVPLNNSNKVQTQAGTLSVGGSTTVDDTGNFDVSAGATLAFAAGTRNLATQATVTGAGAVNFNGATVNFNSSSFSNTGTATVSANTVTFGGPAAFANLNVTGGTATFADTTTTIATLNQTGGTANFNNSGTTITNARLNGGITSFNNTATVTSLSLNAGGQLTGPGNVTLTGASSWMAGTLAGSGTTFVAATGTLAIAGGSNRIFDTRTLTNSGTITWTGNGRILASSNATLNNQAGATFDIQTDSTFLWNDSVNPGPTFYNYGTLQKSVGTGVTDLNVFLVNASSGTVDAQTGNIALDRSNGSNGTLTVESGATLSFPGSSFTLGATATVSGAGTVLFNGGSVMLGGTYNVAGTTSVQGGTATFAGRTTMGTLSQGGGSVNLNNATTAITTMNLTGGMTFFNNAATVTMANLGLGGTLTGTGTVTFSGPSTWTGATLAGSGTTIIAATGTLTLSSGNDKTFNNRTLSNAGTITWTDSGNIVSGFSATLFNQAGALFDIQTDARFYNPSGALSTINNFGTLQKSVGIGTTDIGVYLNNKSGGTVDVQTGTVAVEFSQGSAGAFTVEAPGTLYFSNGAVILAIGSSISGAGTVIFNNNPSTPVMVNGTYNVTGTTTFLGGEAHLDGPTTIGTLAQSGGNLELGNALTTISSLTLTGGNTFFNAAANVSSLNLASGGDLVGTGQVTLTGTSSWTGGVMDGSGTTIVASTGTLTLSSGNDKTLSSRTLNNNGTITWIGSGNLIADSSVVNNLAGATFDAQTDAVYYSHVGRGYGPTSTFNNVGTFQKSAGVNTTSVQQVFTNNGTVLVLSGNLSLYYGTSMGSFSVSTGDSLTFLNDPNNGSPYVLNTGTAFAGNGTVAFNGATVNFEGVVNSTALLSFAGGTVNVDNTTSTANANLLPGGSLSGSGNLRVTNNFSWTGGVMGGTGATTIATTGTLAISSGNDKVISSRTLNNAGTITWTGAGNLIGNGGGVLNNQTGATFDAQNDARFYSSSGGLTITNLGTFKKSGGNAVTSIEEAFNNTGTLLVSAATLALNGGTSTGTFTVAAGATLSFVGGTNNLESGTTLGGAGTASFTGGTVNFDGTVTSTALLNFAGGAMSFNGAATTANANLLPGGSFQGSGNFTVTGTLTWTGGTMAGSGVTTIPASATIAIGSGNDKVISSRTLNNAGTITWTGSGNLIGNGAGVLNNQAGATFDAQNDARFYSTSGGLTINNLGTFKKSAGIAVTSIEETFNNNGGTLLVSAATLNLNGGTSTGTFTVAAGATLSFVGGTNNLESGTMLGGAGTVSLAGGTVNFDGTVTSTALLSFAGGTVSFNGAATTANANLLPGGSFQGSGNFTVTGTLTWTGGTMAGSGVTTIPASATVAIGSGNDKVISSRTLNNAGTITWTGSGNLVGNGGGVLNNQAGATFDAQNDARFYSSSGGLTINNLGTFKKSAGIAVTSIEETFNNTGGTVLVSAAMLNLNGGTSTGTFTVSAGATLNFPGGTNNLEDGTKLTGAGTVSFTGANVNFDGTVTSTALLSFAGGAVSFNGTATTANANLLPPGSFQGNGSFTITGTLNWTGGTMTGGGTTVVASTATVILSGGDNKVLNSRTLNNAGTITWTGSGNFIGNNGGVLNNQAGATFDAQNDARFYPTSGSLTFNNLGTFKKSAGIGVTSIEETFNNLGSVQVKAATLAVNGGSGTSTGAFTVTAGFTLSYGGGTQELASGASVTGAGAVLFNGANVTFDSGATYNVTGATSFTGGNVTFNGTATAAVMNFSGGNTYFNAATTVATLIQTGGNANFNFSGITLTNLSLSGGTTAINNGVSGAKLNLALGGTLAGTGTLTLTSDSVWTGGTMSGSGTTVIAAMATLTVGSANDKVLNSRTLTNAGTITWTGPGNIQANNGTTINNQAGALFDIQTDALLYNPSGATPTFNNAGTLQKSAGGGTATIQSFVFNSSGTVDVQITTLNLGNGGTNSGAFTVEAGGNLAFVSGNSTTLTSKSSITGAGSVTFNQGSVTLDGATYNITGTTYVVGGTVNFTGPTTIVTLSMSGGNANFNTAPTITTLNQTGGASSFNTANTTLTNLNLTGGTTNVNNTAAGAKLTLGGGNLSGTGLLTLSSDSTWSAGSMTGSGTTVIAGTGTLTLSSANDKVLDARTLTNAGILTWTGTGNFQANHGCVINNLAGANFYIQTDAYLYNNTGGTPTFNNAGTVQKSAGSSVAYIQGFNFNSSGTVDVMTTTLTLNNGGTSSGSFTVEAGGALVFPGNTSTLTNRASITGAGNVTFNGANVTLAGATYNVTGTTMVTGGTVNVTGTTTIANLPLSGGTVNFNTATATITTLTQTGGEVDFTNVSTAVTNLNLSGGNTYIRSSVTATKMILVPGGTLAGNGTLTLTGASQWTGGAMTDPGVTTVAATGSLAISGGDIKYFLYRTLNNAGTITWTGTGSIYGYYSAVLNNLQGGTVDIQSDAVFYDYGPATHTGSPTFTNAGTLKKSMGIATSDLQGYFNNNGSVKAQAGTLNVNNGTSAGSFDAAASATLSFGGGTHNLTVNGSLTGAGTIFFSTTVNIDAAVNITGIANVTGGTTAFTNASTTIAALNLSGGTTNFNNTATVTNLSLSGATLQGIGVLTITGAASWTGGVMSGSGATVLAAGGTLALTGGNAKDLAGRTFNNAGTITWTGLGNFYNDSGSIINNQSGATFDIQTDARLYQTGGSPQSVFFNYGTLQKSAGFANTTIEIPLTNIGTVKVLAATLSLTNNDTSPGAFTVAANATLAYPGGTHGLTSTSTISGAGNLTLNGATLSDDGTVNITGTLTVTGGTSTFNGNVTVGPLFQNGGTVNFNGTTTFGALTLTGGTANFGGTTTGTSMAFTGGTLTGAGILTLSGTSSWMAGTMSGTGTTAIAATGILNLNSGNDKTLDTRALSNAGVITWTGNGHFMIANGSTVTNQRTGLFDAQNDVRFGWNGNGNEPTFNNLGTFQKSAGSATTNMEFTVNNNGGTIKALSGTLNITRDGSSSGTYQSGAGATVNFSGSSTHTLMGGTLSGAGTIQGMGATLLITGSVTAQNFNLANGTLRLATSGTLTLNGNYTQGGNGTLLIDSIKGTVPGADYGQLLVTGTASFQGTLTVTVASGYVPGTGTSYKIVTFANRTASDFGTKNIPSSLSLMADPMDLTLKSTHLGPGPGPGGVGRWGSKLGNRDRDSADDPRGKARLDGATLDTLPAAVLIDQEPGDVPPAATQPTASPAVVDEVFAESPVDSLGDVFSPIVC